MVTTAAQDYLKSIYKLQNGTPPVETVNTSMIAEKMQVAAASATNMVKKLAEIGLLQHTPYHGVELTPAGETVALEVIRHHRLLEAYLTQALGYDWDEVDEEAERLEHVISEDFEERIDKALGHPTVDPHGAPIPSKQGMIPEARHVSLGDLLPGRQTTVGQVSDRDPDMLREMDARGLRPGAGVEVIGPSPDGEGIRVQVEGAGEHTLPVALAARVYTVVVEGEGSA
jgi:DtxR family transcriptional regulator, Mn-dependent transcriptional regulator